MNNIPFARSYWVIPNRFLAGFFPGSQDLEQERANMEGLVRVGIRHVINLMEDGELDHQGRLFRPYQKSFTEIAALKGIDATWERIPVHDVSVPSRAVMAMILDRVDQALAEGRPVYVHCWGGKGRTGTVVGCYLVRHGIAEGKTALRLIQEMRCNDPRAHEPSPETEEQRQFVLHWKREE
jgi:protein-tyrosine phosphatase